MGSRWASIVFLLSCAGSVTGCGEANLWVEPSDPTGLHDHEVDLFFQMSSLDSRKEPLGLPEGERLSKIVDFGARSVQWFQRLQSHLAVEDREPLWRRTDGIGNEPTSDRPRKNNPQLILEGFDRVLLAAPTGMRRIIDDSSVVLPTLPPEGVELSTALAWLRRVNSSYSRASRFLALYPNRTARPQSTRDFRPIIDLRQNRREVLAQAAAWSELSAAERRLHTDRLLAACAALDAAPDSGSRRCVDSVAAIRNTPGVDRGAKVESATQAILTRADSVWNARFRVVRRYPGANPVRQGSKLILPFGVFNAGAQTLAWMDQIVTKGWDEEGVLGLQLSEAPSMTRESVRVHWVEGVLPFVNGVGGNTITMDGNLPLWLEQVKLTMAHEFGHVLGFADCYVEFWSEEEASFVYYVLDPQNRMCALSGETLALHHEALTEAYSVPGAH